MISRINILFLRKQGPLVHNGGDIDNQIKTLFDALKMPNPNDPGEIPEEGTPDPMYFLLEDDSLITGYGVETDRLLSGLPDDRDKVRLIMEVNLRMNRSTWTALLFLPD
jgi:hypothetical protein